MNFPFCPENLFSPVDNFKEYMFSVKPESYTKCKKLICDWTDKQKYLVHYSLLKFFVRNGMKINKVNEVISFKQEKWLEKYIDYNTQKRNKTNNDFEKNFYKLLKNAFYGKTMQNAKTVKWRSKLSFNGIHKSYGQMNSFTFNKLKF